MMTYPELKIGDLTAKKPIIQGGMGIGISLSRLAGAVAKAGGVGVISTAQIGFREPDFDSIKRLWGTCTGSCKSGCGSDYFRCGTSP